MPRSHRHLVQGLIVLASVIGTLAVFAVWLDRQALDTNEWTNTSSKLLENDKVRGVLADYLVARLYAHVNVGRELAQVFPRRERALAGPAADGLKVVATQAIQRALVTPPVVALFQRANRAAHAELLAVIDGKNPAVSADNGVVTLDLGGLLSRFGASGIAGVAISPGFAKVQILRSDQLKTVELAARVTRQMVVVLVLLAVGLYAAAILLARGWRRVALRNVGIGAICTGIVVLILRDAIGNYVVDQLSRNAVVHPAASEVWSIGTSLLSQTAGFLIFDGVLIVLVAALAGPTRVAHGLRGLAARYLWGRPVLIYAIVFAVFALFVAWGPTLAFRQPISIAIIAVLLVIGTEALRRQVRSEFPRGESGATAVAVRQPMGRLRRDLSEHLAAMRGAFSNGARGRDGHQRPRPIGPADLALLEQLADLRDRGALTEEEFAAEKELILPRR